MRFGVLIKMTTSSAYAMAFVFFIFRFSIRSFTYRLKSTADRTPPCGSFVMVFTVVSLLTISVSLSVEVMAYVRFSGMPLCLSFRRRVFLSNLSNPFLSSLNSRARICRL